jgi:uncharacterized protein involved in exopolysaccharide biosynthesis
MHETTTIRPSLRDLLFTLFRYRWTALGSFLLILAVGIIITARAPRIYEVRTRVFVGADVKQLRLNQSDQTLRVTLEELISTEVEIAKSLPVLDEALKLSGNDAQGRVLPVDKLMSSLTILPVHNTSLMELRVQHQDPEYARVLLDNIVQTYINRRQARATKDEEQSHYEAMLTDINQRIDQTEQVYNDFNAQNDITQFATQQLKDEERLVSLDNTRVEQERQLLVLRRDVGALDSLLADFDPALIPSELVEKDLQVKNWLDEILRIQRERLDLLTRLNESAPEIVRLDQRLTGLNKELKRHFSAHVQSMHHSLRSLQDDLALIRREIAAIKSRSSGLAGATSRHMNLDQQLEDLRSVRTVLTRQLEETRIRGAESGSIRVEQLEPARSPRSPVKPNVLFNMTATLVLAFIMGISLPFYRQIVNSVLFHDYDVARATGLPVLCSVRIIKNHGK